MIRVESRQGETVDRLLRRFKKICEKEGLIKDLRRTAYYEKPSERKRRKEKAAKKAMLKEQAKFGK